MGCFVAREYARHRLRRVPLVGVLDAAQVVLPPRSLAQPLLEPLHAQFFAFQAYAVGRE